MEETLPREERGFTLWFTGLSGSGKTTVAGLVEEELRERGRRVEVKLEFYGYLNSLLARRLSLTSVHIAATSRAEVPSPALPSLTSAFYSGYLRPVELAYPLAPELFQICQAAPGFADEPGDIDT